MYALIIVGLAVDIKGHNGIAAAKEPSPQPLGYVYPGAPEPERPSLPSPYTGVGGVGLKSAIQMSKQQSTLPQQQQLPQFSFSDALQSSSWKPSPFAQSGFGRGSNPSSTSVFGGNVSFDEERRFEASLPSGKSYSSFPSSSSNPASGMFMTPQAKERENPRQNPDMSSVLSQLPKSFWGKSLFFPDKKYCFGSVSRFMNGCGH
ncbi:unnamed protein product [Gongylonema pulchrum]|uniref:Ovule protein n=1 Tax=Gongylonema pulchrum TaxID=637853 RepID=A0A183DIX4_9BILA|nr:unnamed protein product [Gongylonema pulchrum]